MEKKFKHSKSEVCGICQKEINTLEDKWVAILDFEGKKNTRTAFYHRQCLNDLLQGKTKVITEKFKNKLKSFTKEMFSAAKTSPQEYGEQLNKSMEKLATT